MTLHAPAVTRLAVALALALSTPLAAARGVPPGFEDLVEGQTEQLDIQLFGRSAGLSPVRVTLEHVQLEDPARVLQALDLTAEAQAALLPALSQPLPRNSHLACRFGGASAGCGYIDPPEAPDEVRALYDEGEGAVRLFVARRWIPGKPAAERFHTVTANAENAFLHQQTLNLSGGRDYQSLSARGVGTLGLFERGHLSAEWYYNQQRYRSHSDDDFQFDNVYYRHDLGPAHYLQAGRMDRRNLSSPQGGTFSFSMLPLDRFQGARLGTTQAYVDTDAAVQASPLTVLLARDARVDVFDGERLLQTFYLQAGINQIDTRNFPFGNYLVRMRIYEDGVLVRTEEAPFDKGGDWTDSQWQWFVQSGRRNERRSDRFDGEQVTVAGMRVPLARDLAATAGVAHLGGHSYGELRVDLRRVLATQEMRATFSGMRGSDGSHGQQHQLSYRRKASWNIYQQRMRGKACQFEADARDRLGCTNSLSGSVSLPIAGGTAYLGYTRRQTWRTGWSRPGGDGPLAPLDPFLPPQPLQPHREPQLSRTWQASFSRSHRWQDFSVSTRLGLWQQLSHDSARDIRTRDRGIYLNVSFTRLQRSHVGNGQRRYAVDMRQPQHQRPETNYSVGQSYRQEVDAQLRELTSELRANNNDRYSASLGGQLQNRYGQTGATVAYYQQHGRSETAYSGTHSSAFALGRRGAYWGAGTGADAGLAVQVAATDDLDLQGVAAELQVSGAGRQRLQIGERRLLPLAAYQSHRAELQDASIDTSMAAIRVSGAGGARPMFLAPGRLMRMPVPIEVTYTFIGTARTLAGAPLGGARILNAPVPGTSANGGFVADFPRRETTLYLLQDDRLLHCPLQVRERRQVVLLVGAVHCEPLAVAQLPAEIRQQARVTRLLQERALIAATPQTAAAGGTP